MKEGRKWLIAAVAMSALGAAEGTATAQGAPADVRREADLRPAAIVTLVPFAGSRDPDTMARFGMPVVNSLYREENVFAYRHDPGDPRCLWDRHEPVCVAQEDILQETNGSRRDALRQGLHDNGGLYRTARIMRRAVHELTIPTTSDDRRDALHAEVLTAIQSDPIVLRAACERRSINDCLLPLRETATTEHFARNLGELAERLENARENVACEFACETASDNQFCQRHHLGRLATVGWDHAPNHTDGGMSLCTASDRDPNCQRRPVIALGRYTCESLRTFWSLVGVQAQARRDRVEAAEQRLLRTIAAEERDEHLLPALLAAHNAAPATTPDRDGDTIADADDQCPDTAQGATPDPQRVGCPAPELQVAERRRSVRRHRHRDRTATARPTPQTLGTMEQFACSPPVTPRAHHWQTYCRASGSRTVERMSAFTAPTRSSSALGTVNHRLARRFTTARVAALVAANPSSRPCGSPFILACRKTSATGGEHPRFIRRLGICRAANGDDEEVTFASFRTLARTECGTNPTTVWIVPGSLIRIPLGETVPQFMFGGSPPAASAGRVPRGGRPESASLYDPHPDSGTEASELRVAVNDNFTANSSHADVSATTNPAYAMTPGTPRGLLASCDFVRCLTASPLARTFPQSHPNVRYAEVTARSGTTTRGDKVSALGPPRRCPAGMRCWWHPPLSAIA